jgi:hypothetical protein
MPIIPRPFHCEFSADRFILPARVVIGCVDGHDGRLKAIAGHLVQRLIALHLEAEAQTVDESNLEYTSEGASTNWPVLLVLEQVLALQHLPNNNEGYILQVGNSHIAFLDESHTG